MCIIKANSRKEETFYGAKCDINQFEFKILAVKDTKRVPRCQNWSFDQAIT